MKETIILLDVISYFAIFFLGVLAFVHAGDFIAYLLKKFPPDPAHPKRTHASASRKSRRSTSVA